MLHSVEKRTDGSLALFINGDLQFDSKDERIYHEALALPALALAQKRHPSALRALIIGGGDGLIARELFKSASIEHVDLVDYDENIVALARHEFAAFNDGSMSDKRISAHILDAWQFVEDALAAGTAYNLIITDLTVAADLAGAKFHSIEWYQNIRQLLSDGGILAVNGVSPQKTPEAFWSIFNSMLSSGLYPRPYRVSISSFSKLGYGEDWGFFLASSNEIAADELDDEILAAPRVTLTDVAHIRTLFCLPEQLLAFQPAAAPAHSGSDILLHYFRNNTELETQATTTIDSFALDAKSLTVPAADSGKHLLPPELRAALAQCIHCEGEERIAANEPALVDKVLELMPALQQFHTPEIIADFVENPAAFLEAIDIAGLVERLLKRAAELPSQLVEELKHLSEKLQEWSGDYFSLVSLGERVITILTLVVVVGNFMYPDAVYGKGGHGDHGEGGHHGDGAHRGRGDHADRGFDGARRNAFADAGRGYGGYRGYWGHHWGAWGWARPYHGFYWGGYVPPVYYGGSNWTNTNVSNNEYVNETGTTYPAPSYNYSGTGTGGGASVAGNAQASPTRAAYKLADGADILPSGYLAVPLTNQAYLMPTPQGTQLIDQTTGQSIVNLYNDPALLYQSAVELKRQHHRLENAIKRAQNAGSGGGDSIPPERLAKMQKHVDLLQTALNNLGPIPPNPPGQDAVAPLVPGGTELFASVWMAPGGKYLVIKRANGKTAYMDKDGWYSDMGKTRLHTPYPTKLKSTATAFLSKMVADADANKNMLLQDQKEGQAHLDAMQRELSDYQSASNAQPDDMVDFGSRKLKRSEAIRLTNLALTRTQNKLQELQDQINAMPNELKLAQAELANLGGSSS